MTPEPRSRSSSLVRDAARLQEALRELIRVIQHQDRHRASGYDLSVSQCHALEIIAREGPKTVTDLGDALFLEKSTASRLARGLVHRGLIRKRSPGSDSRVVILQLTEGGIRLSRKVLNDLSERYRALLDEVPEAVRGPLPKHLEQLTASLLAQDQGGGPHPT